MLFRVSAVLAAIAIVTIAYLYRLRNFAASLKVHFDARLQERTRLARDLHDTLLQTIQGTKMVAESAREHVNDQAVISLCLDRVAAWLDRASQEGRAALEALRTTSIEADDLSGALRSVADDCDSSESMITNISTTGKIRELHPVARDEVYRIGYEAIRNACGHSGASQLWIELVYKPYFQLTVRDDGCGIDKAVLRSGKPGHFGLAGMRERASSIGGKLDISSSEKSGTVISLIVPGSVIYKRRAKSIRSWFKDLIAQREI